MALNSRAGVLLTKVWVGMRETSSNSFDTRRGIESSPGSAQAREATVVPNGSSARQGDASMAADLRFDTIEELKQHCYSSRKHITRHG